MVKRKDIADKRMPPATKKAKKSNTTAASSAVYVCPVTNHNVHIGKATLKDLKAKSTYAKTSKRLWTLPSTSVRTDLLVEAAKAIAEVEQSLLPSFGGRSWEVTCQLSDPGPQVLFRTWNGRMELAVLPHLIEKIPQPPTWPGRKSTPDEYEEGEDDDPFELQQREISTLSQLAWELRDRKHPIPTVSLKWQSPERKMFNSRKSAWEHATAMAAREVEINKNILGIGASGKLLQPFVPSEKTVLQVGTLRFERDGLWVIGQELEWQEDRPELVEEAEAAEEERRLNLAPTNALELFLVNNRQKYVETHDECETVKQVEAELRKVWKQLSKEEKDEYRKHFKTEKPEKKETDIIANPKRPRKQKEPEPEPIKLSITPRDFYVNSRRLAFVEERRIKRPGWGDLKPSEVDVHLRQEWKDLSSNARKEWTDKVIAIEMEKLEAERKIQELEAAAIREKEEAEREVREALEAVERERTELEREAKEAAEAAAVAEAERMEHEAQETVKTAIVAENQSVVAKVDDNVTASVLGSFMIVHEEEKKEDDPSMPPNEMSSKSDVTPSGEFVDSVLKESQSPNKRLVDMLKKKRILSARSSKRLQFPTEKLTSRWCMNQAQIDKCFVACMDHYETVMRTVKARDLHRELQDGFDVFRERGFGRYDMELPVFEDSTEFGFLTDMTQSPWMPVVKAILGDDALLIHKGCFLSMPGSAPQVYHQDGVHLTTQTQRPCHAINVFIPLVDLTSRNGPTEFCLGSHILGLEGYDRDFVYTPTAKAGNPVIFDYRLGHRGLGNSGEGVRPIVYVTYARATQGNEFRDSVNFSRKRYHKIGELKSEAMTREERKNRRKRSMEDREAEELERAVIESVQINNGMVSSISRETDVESIGIEQIGGINQAGGLECTDAGDAAIKNDTSPVGVHEGTREGDVAIHDISIDRSGTGE